MLFGLFRPRSFLAQDTTLFTLVRKSSRTMDDAGVTKKAKASESDAPKNSETKQKYVDQMIQDLYAAALHRISQLNKESLTHGHTGINEPSQNHIPGLVSLGEYGIHATKSIPKVQMLTRGGKIGLDGILANIPTRNGRGRKCTSILLQGPTGSGKTTLVRKMALYGMQGKVKNLEGKLIIIPDFRTLPPNENIRVSQALLGGMFSNLDDEEIQHKYQWMVENSEKVVFFVDSLDTLPYDLTKEPRVIGHDTVDAKPEDVMHNLLSRVLFPKSMIVMASRDYKIRFFHYSIRFDRYVVLNGLNEDSVTDLIGEYLGEERGEVVKRHIAEECPDVWPLLSLPGFLAFAVIVLAEDLFKPRTMSEILTKFFLHVLRSASSLDRNDLREVLIKLAPMAFDGILCGQVLFSPEDLSVVGVTPSEIANLDKERYLISTLTQDSHFFLHFNHKMQQEFLSALHVLSEKLDDFKGIVGIDTEFYNGARLNVVRRFVCGILFNSEVLETVGELCQITDIDQKKSFLLESLAATLKREPSQPGSGENLIELYIDVNEARDVATEVIRSSVDTIPLFDSTLITSNVAVVAAVMRRCEFLEHVCLISTNLDERKVEILYRMLMDSNLKIDSLICSHNDVGSKGLNQLAKLATHFQVKRLDVGSCSMEKEHLEAFVSGAKESNMKVDDINLEDQEIKPHYDPMVLGLLPHAKNELILRHWIVNETELREIQRALNEIGPPSVVVVFGEDYRNVIRLKAWPKDTTIDQMAEVELSEKINNEMTRPVTTTKSIGSKGGELEIRGASLKFQENAFDELTSTSIMTKLQDEDVPEDCVPISPEIYCSTSGVEFRGCAILKIPTYYRNLNGEALIMCRKSKHDAWEKYEGDYKELDLAITFQLRRMDLCCWRVLWRKLWAYTGNMMLQHHLFFKRSMYHLQICGITCIGDEGVSESCNRVMKEEGYRHAKVLHDNVPMREDETMSYTLQINAPPNTRIAPRDRVEHMGKEISTNIFKLVAFHLEPNPDPGVNSARMTYALQHPNHGPELSALLLD